MVTIWSDMADVLDEAAALCIDGISEHDRVRRHPVSHADFDKAAFVEDFGSKRPAQWLSQAIGYYLADCAYELRALGTLLRLEIVGATLEVLVRAILERVGRISWLLDLEPEDALDDAETTRHRAVRASFEALVSAQTYRRGVEMIRADKDQQKRVAVIERDFREVIRAWFEVVQPSTDPENPNSLDATANTWTIDGEHYPNYLELAEWAIAGGTISAPVAKGTYAALSGWSHPNFIAATEHRATDQSYAYNFDFLQRLLQLALFGYLKAFKAWSGYYEFNADEFDERCDQIAAVWEATTPNMALDPFETEEST